MAFGVEEVGRAKVLVALAISSGDGGRFVTDREEDLIVAFLKTLTDGYMTVPAPGDAIGASISTAAPPTTPAQ